MSPSVPPRPAGRTELLLRLLSVHVLGLGHRLVAAQDQEVALEIPEGHMECPGGGGVCHVGALVAVRLPLFGWFFYQPLSAATSKAWGAQPGSIVELTFQVCAP
eukprot:SAG31_NODE_148_length_22511_cov_20.369266_3_plen_104_part_00